jgi:hypothetical protein
LQYGGYVIVMNCSDDKNLPLTIPPAFAGGRDLISGMPAGGLAGARLKPLSTLVLDTTK